MGSDGTVFRGLLLTWTPRVFEAMAAAQECKDAALVDLVRSQLEGQATVVATVGEAGKLFVASAPIHDVANPLEDSPARGRLPGYGLRVRLRPGLGLGTGNEVLIPVHVARRELLRRDVNPAFASFWEWHPHTL